MAQQLYKGALKKLEDLSSDDWLVGFKEDNGTIAERIVISDFIDVLGLAKASEIKNFAENDLNFTANRTHNLKDKYLILNNASSIQFRAGLETGATQDTNFTMVNSRILATFSSTTTGVTSMLNVGGGDATLSYSTATYIQEIQSGSSGNIISSNRAEQAALRIDSTVGGFMGPRVTTVQRDAMSPLASWLVYNTNDNEYQFYDGTTWVSAAGSLNGSGTNNYVAKWTPDGSTLGNSLIRDNGNGVGIGVAPDGVNFYTYISQNSLQTSLYSTTSFAGSGSGRGLQGHAIGAALGSNFGVVGSASGAASSNIGGQFTASGTNPYALKLQDGTQGLGKFLKSVDANGSANWATLTESDISDLGTYALVGTYNDGFIPKWNSTTNTLESGVIRDNGSTIGIGSVASSTELVTIQNNSTYAQTAFILNTQTNSAAYAAGMIAKTATVHAKENYGIRGEAVNSSDSNIGVYGLASASSIPILPFNSAEGIGGVFVSRSSTADNIGLYTQTTDNSTGDNIGLYINTSNAGTGNAYIGKFLDGNQGLGKVLTSDANGNASWQTATADNMATADLTLTGDRAHDLNGNKLTLKTSSSTTGYLGIKNSETTSGVEVLKIWGDIAPRNANLLNEQAKIYIGAYNDPDQFELGSLYAYHRSRVLILPTGTTGDAHFQIRGATASVSSTKLFLVEANTSQEAFRITNDRQTYTKRLNVTGLGSTSATTSLLVENSLSTQLFKMDDAGGFALGSGASYSTTNAVTIGNNALTSADFAISIGASTDATSASAIAIGYLAQATNSQAIAIGRGANTTQSNSISLGYNTDATNTGTIAFGNQAQATGYEGITMGTIATASGGRSTSLGSRTIASATRSLALGNQAQATANYNVMINAFNGAKANNVANSFAVNCNSADHLFFIGNTVDGWINTTGNIGIGLTTGINEKLYVSGNIGATGQIYSVQASAITVTANASTFDGDNGNSQPLDLASATADITLTFTNLKAGSTYFIPVTQKASSPVNIGTYVISGGTVKFPSGTAPTISTGASAIDTLVCYYDGTDVLVNYSQNYS